MKKPTFFTLLLLALPLATVHAQTFFCDPLVGLCTNMTISPPGIAGVTQAANGLQQATNNLTATENNLKAQYGLTAFYQCYSPYSNPGSICTEGDTYDDASCSMALQSCLENNALANEKTQATTQPWQPKAIPSSVLTQALCLMSKNAQWSSSSQTCDCSAGYQRASGQTTQYAQSADCTVIPGTTVPSTCPAAYAWSDKDSSCELLSTQLTSNPVGVSPPTFSVQSASNAPPASSPHESNNQICTKYYGVESFWTGKLNGNGAPTCDCTVGYTINTAGTHCVVASPKSASDSQAIGDSSTTMAMHVQAGPTAGGPGFWTALVHLLNPFSWFR